MRKKRLKSIRALATYMRSKGRSFAFHYIPEYKTGEEFLKEGASFKEGTIVDNNVMYKRKRTVIVEINYLQQLKKAFRRDGTAGIQKYIKDLNLHNQRMEKVFKEMKLKQEIAKLDEGFLKVVSGKASSFWSSLAAFLFSFLAFFGKQREE